MSDASVHTLDGDPGAHLPHVACWLCGRAIPVRISKDGKPFLTCMDCGMQVFVRSEAGAARLRDKAGGRDDQWPV